jgi:hypothetical protein
VHTLAKVLLLVLLLMYFFAGFAGIFIAGIYIWILSVVFLFVSLVISKTMYENAPRVSEKKPEEEKAEPEAPVGTEAPVEEEGAHPREVQCLNCGEIFTLQEWDTPASSMCPACGSIGSVELGEVVDAEPVEKEEPVYRSRSPPSPPPAQPPSPPQ